MPSRIPPSLLEKFVSGNSSVVLVAGSGCSVEETNLPTSPEASRRLYRRLENEGVLSHGSVPDPSDLEAVVQAVISAGYSKEEATSRLREQLRGALPNTGHRVAAALVLEERIDSILTINFDLALSYGVVSIGGQHSIEEIRCAKDIGRLGRKNLIYLHGTVESPTEDWILTQAEVASDWTGHWQGPVARRILCAPAVVFAGIGTEVGVLVRSLSEIKRGLGEETIAYVVDPGNPEASQFVQSSGIPHQKFLKMSWNEFMVEVGDRVAMDICARIRQTSVEMSLTNGWREPDLDAITSAISQRGLLGVGRMLAGWLGKPGNYHPWRETRDEWVADLLIALDALGREGGFELEFTEDGVILSSGAGGGRGPRIILAHGQGSERWSSLISRAGHRRAVAYDSDLRTTIVIGAGFSGPPPQAISSPPDITRDLTESSENLIDGPAQIRYWDAENVRTDPATILN